MIDLKQGDCLEIMKDIPDKSIDMILCDLPYGIITNIPKNGKWDVIIPFEPLWEQYNRIIKDNGAIVLFGNEPFSSKLRLTNIEKYKYDIKWDKLEGGSPFLAKKQPLRQYEDIMIFYKKQPTYNPLMEKRDKPIKVGSLKKSNYQKDESKLEQLKKKTYEYKNPTNIIKFKKIKNGAIHPTQKPVALLEYLIKTYTNENDTVLDNCMGSGSTGVACKNLNRNFIGIELDDKYFEIAKERIESENNK